MHGKTLLDQYIIRESTRTSLQRLEIGILSVSGPSQEPE